MECLFSCRRSRCPFPRNMPSRQAGDALSIPSAPLKDIPGMPCGKPHPDAHAPSPTPTRESKFLPDVAELAGMALALGGSGSLASRRRCLVVRGREAAFGYTMTLPTTRKELML
jgi:hypothetical protein